MVGEFLVECEAHSLKFVVIHKNCSFLWPVYFLKRRGLGRILGSGEAVTDGDVVCLRRGEGHPFQFPRLPGRRSGDAPLCGGG